MRTHHLLLATALMIPAVAAAADYEAGQIWSANGRKQDPDPKVLILRVESETPVGEVIFVAADGLKLCLPNGQCGGAFSPLAMSKQALDRSVKELTGKADRLPDFEKGYQFWKDGVAKGALVTITVPLAEALDQIEGGTKIQVK
jgi:hypothetical protein